MADKKRSRLSFNVEQAMSSNLIGRKLHEERRLRGMTLDDVCLMLKDYGLTLQRGAISKWETGVTNPNAYQLMAVCSALGIEDPVSYFTGNQELNPEGRRRIVDYKNDLIASGRYAPEPDISNMVYIDMPVSLLSASAGTGSFLDQDSFETVSVPKDSVPAGAEFGIRVCGDSMAPVYSDGQTVWVKSCSSLKVGDIGLFVLDGSGYIKMYSERRPDSPEEWTGSDGVLHMQPVLVSYNRNYAPIVVGRERSLSITGKVL